MTSLSLEKMPPIAFPVEVRHTVILKVLAVLNHICKDVMAKYMLNDNFQQLGFEHIASNRNGILIDSASM
jgi:hypothetical protein